MENNLYWFYKPSKRDANGHICLRFLVFCTSLEYTSSDPPELSTVNFLFPILTSSALPSCSLYNLVSPTVPQWVTITNLPPTIWAKSYNS